MRTDSFAIRHIGPKKEDLSKMLETVGVKDIDQLIYETFPDGIRLKNPLELPEAMSEYEYLSHIQELGDKK